MLSRVIGLLSVMLIALASVANETIRTMPLDILPDDPAAAMIEGVDRFLLKKIEQARKDRKQYWRGDSATEENRIYLRECLGLEASVATGEFEFSWPPICEAIQFKCMSVRWPVLNDPQPVTTKDVDLKGNSQHVPVSLWGHGVLWMPTRPSGDMAIFLSDSSEASAGRSVCAELAHHGLTVLEIARVDDALVQHGGAVLTRREFLNRSAFELGRTLAGYEVQAVQTAINCFENASTEDCKTVVCGWGEGARIALYAAAIDQRIDLTVLNGYFGPREQVWSEPIERNVFGLLNRFGDAELVASIAPRKVVIRSEPVYELKIDGKGAAPADWHSPKFAEVQAEFERISKVLPGDDGSHANLLKPSDPRTNFDLFADCLDLCVTASKSDVSAAEASEETAAVAKVGAWILSANIPQRLQSMIDRHTQALLRESDHERSQFMNIGYSRDHSDNATNKIDTSTIDTYIASIERYREIFRNDVIGWFSDELVDIAAKSKQSYSGDGWTGHNVVIDVFPGVFAYGVLLWPDGIKPTEKRPVVVCQHGLEGRPQDTIFDDHRAYHDYAARLASEGFIVFAPQNLYIGKDNFRTLQRKSYSIGKTLFSMIGVQHQQILRWLQSIPNVDPKRIAFYGLSYGGKSAMRLPALLPDYCLSICSADFNDWIWKNASTRERYSYVGTGEYEIFEFGLGKKFNYAEMAALIAPRPFMVERGHFDGVGPDDRVAKEFAKVRYLYQARLKLENCCEIEWFDGPHSINGKGTFDFLRYHLKWGQR